jgi:peptidoglycan LD-endopeptidase CwlK
MFKLGTKSLAELNGVHPKLVRVVKRAIELSEVDFSVHDGLRTEAEQRRYVVRGVSKTMNSKHLPQPDGTGHAVDLVPYINGKLRWEWPAIFKIAEAVVQAARELEVDLRWGGCWQHINPLSGWPEEWEQAYVARKRKAGKRAFPDGPHFELWPG